ncbi:TPA: hypothetical protein ACS781_003827 [Providencia alcalifaciens]|uniref:Phage protein n=1 Tax=Providencia alcalifaciens 205/92 TaxID=1256988 RepID=A0AAV3M8A8_9GAMM|nr:hypothetical protein [Providencia alcalifaciens]EUD11957.1 hypothetical protein HMPREF1563_1561 [Providencia alcalifaciens 205/92]WGZ53546.1 hypothetical protein PO864_15020 [Providencia alcalifaciens]
MHTCHRCGDEIESVDDIMDGDDYGFDEVCKECLDELKEDSCD